MNPGPRFVSTQDLQFELGEGFSFFSIEKCCCYHQIQMWEKFTGSASGGYLRYGWQVCFFNLLPH